MHLTGKHAWKASVQGKEGMSWRSAGVVVVGAMMAAAVAVVVWTSRTRHCIVSPTYRRTSGDLPCAAVRTTQEVVYHTPGVYHTRVVH